jgi:hypothetical protein
MDTWLSQIEACISLPDIIEMQKDAQRRHQEVLDMIEKLSEATASEGVSTVCNSSMFTRCIPTFHREADIILGPPIGIGSTFPRMSSD